MARARSYIVEDPRVPARTQRSPPRAEPGTSACCQKGKRVDDVARSVKKKIECLNVFAEVAKKGRSSTSALSMVS